MEFVLVTKNYGYYIMPRGYDFVVAPKGESEDWWIDDNDIAALCKTCEEAVKQCNEWQNELDTDNAIQSEQFNQWYQDAYDTH